MTLPRQASLTRGCPEHAWMDRGPSAVLEARPASVCTSAGSVGARHAAQAVPGAPAHPGPNQKGTEEDKPRIENHKANRISPTTVRLRMSPKTCC